MRPNASQAEISRFTGNVSGVVFFFYRARANKAAKADHYPRAVGPILDYDLTTKSLVDSAALRGSRVKIRAISIVSSNAEILS